MEVNYELASAVRGCNKCPAMVEYRERTGGLVVPADLGILYNAGGIAVICEAPGAQEAATSKPLVGTAGRIFNSLLDEAEIDRRSLVLLNRVRCRPPNNKLAMVPEAIPNCDPWLVAELEAYAPKVVVLMGGTSLSVIFGANVKVGAIRGASRTTGTEFPYGPRTWIATYHPASLTGNRSPENRPLVVADLALAKKTWEDISTYSSDT